MRRTMHPVPGILPHDAEAAILIARIIDPARAAPIVAVLRDDVLVDVSSLAPTVSHLLEIPDAPTALANARAAQTWPIADVVDASLERDPARPRLLAPIDLQVIKACGVTFADSLLERVIEEQAAGDPAAAEAIRARMAVSVGTALDRVRPGSPEALELKRALIAEGMWSQYLEVGIGPDPEVFTKAPVLSSVGFGARIGVLERSQWNNPEPELVLVMDSSGIPVAATLGNDVNLRDLEGRSALLLGAAKDNNGSCAVGPFLRLFDERFGLERLRTETIGLRIEGEDGFVLEGASALDRISRPFEELISAAFGDHHQYPDGFALFTGTVFAPVQDRDQTGHGFTHRVGDRVTISSPSLGSLVNTVGVSEELEPWTFGIRALMAALTAEHPRP
ncbi:fumarylacetoacetate hydrolase family protein [Agromyces aurantiacus]|uniref:Fumarylacetoacetate hydrolase family protein n=1 Tax=Agromyces aurantiacus TaxID=165814 RepID=A0ABV9R568_9MICO|nr:fumarylacetoacetate hydrolase [Agromyces aurantiacus]MBM7503961.1 fumarylacetoacetate (FAA) hydrolase family protein [Agromyces aurantiacus]